MDIIKTKPLFYFFVSLPGPWSHKAFRQNRARPFDKPRLWQSTTRPWNNRFKRLVNQTSFFRLPSLICSLKPNQSHFYARQFSNFSHCQRLCVCERECVYTVFWSYFYNVLLVQYFPIFSPCFLSKIPETYRLKFLAKLSLKYLHLESILPLLYYQKGRQFCCWGQYSLSKTGLAFLVESMMGKIET